MNETSIERLNQAIDNLQSERKPLSGMEPLDAPVAANQEAALLRVAALLNAMRPGVGQPTPTFVADLRARVLSA